MSRPAPRAIAYYLAAAILIALAIVPALWLANVALQPGTGYDLGDLTRPRDYSLANFRGAGPSLVRPFLNSVFVTIAQAGLNVLLAALAAYPLARMNFRGRDILFVLLLATLMVPEQVIVVPLFITVIDLGLFDTLAAVVIPFSVSAFGIYLCRQAFAAIPPDLEEAAHIDGAHAWQIWWHVMLPLTAPTLATLAIFSIIGAWSNLLWPLIVLQSDAKYTLPVAINQLLGVFGDNIRYAYAASLLALIPMLITYAVLQKPLQKGLLAGAVKG